MLFFCYFDLSEAVLTFNIGLIKYNKVVIIVKHLDECRITNNGGWKLPRM